MSRHASSPHVGLAAFLAAALLSAPAPAQLSDWVSIGASPAAPVKIEQNIAIVRDWPVFHAFSCVTREWSSIMMAFNPVGTYELKNEHCIVVDGPVFWGYSPRTGAWSAKVTFTPGAAIIPSSSPQTWHTAIADGNLVHVYFAISGHWETYAFSSPPTVANGYYTLCIDDGSTVYGISDFYGALVPLFFNGASVFGSYGNVGVAVSGGMVHGFSASRNSWASLPAAGPITVNTGNSQPIFVEIEDGSQISFFSGNTGSFTTLPASANATISLERAVAFAVDGMTTYAYSGLLGSYATLTSTSPPTVITEQYFGLVDDGASVTPFSAADGTFGPAFPVPGSQIVTSAQVALAGTGYAGTGAPLGVYSTYLNTWVNPPAGVIPTNRHLTAASVIFEDPAGLHGWSMRGTTWTFLPTGSLSFVAPGASPPQLAETFLAIEGNTLHAFNARNGAWRTQNTAAAPSLRKAHHHTILCGDGTAAYAFDAWNDRWAVQPFTTPGLILDSSNSNTQVQSAYVQDGGLVHAYSGVGQLSMVNEYPHYYRAATQGSIIRLDLAGESGSFAVLGVSPLAASIPAGAAGTLLIDPSTMFILAQPFLSSNRVFFLTLQIPVAPWISGLELHFQAALQHSSSVYLTNNAVMTIY